MPSKQEYNEDIFITDKVSPKTKFLRILIESGIAKFLPKGISIDLGLPYGEMHIHGNSTATAIGTVNIPTFIQGLFANSTSKGFTFAAGETAAITAFADAGSGQVTVTSANTLSEGDIVSISGTTSYNGIFTATNVSSSAFEITDTFVANDATGNFQKGDSLTADAETEGVYKLDQHCYGNSASAAKTFEFEVYKNGVAIGPVESKSRFGDTNTQNVSGGGLVTLVAGDIITYGITGTTDATNFTMVHANIVLHKV